jgi:hypothetical protein
MKEKPVILSYWEAAKHEEAYKKIENPNFKKDYDKLSTEYNNCRFCKKSILINDAIYLVIFFDYSNSSDKYYGYHIFCNETCINCFILAGGLP